MIERFYLRTFVLLLAFCLLCGAAGAVEPSFETPVRRICFMDATEQGYLDDADAKLFVYTDAGDALEMIQTTDTVSGRTLWYADVSGDAADVTFCRASALYDEESASGARWEKWFAGVPETSVYSARGHQKGSWTDEAAAVPSGSMEDLSYGLWMDTRGEGQTEDVIKWYPAGGEYHFYVPSYADLSRSRIYSSFDSFVIDGTAYRNGDEVPLSAGEHQLAVTEDGETVEMGVLRVWQSAGTAALLLTTKDDLFTGLTDVNLNRHAWPGDSGITAQSAVSAYKDAVQTKGTYRLYNEAGVLVNEDETLKKIGARGNSSFEASMRFYGKYAYNITLGEKAALIDGATASKKWCLLANNVDHAMMRNTFVYALADEVGVAYSPETRLVDVYDNGEYLGAYILTEKVEYGKNTLMGDLKNLDDGNEAANIDHYGNEAIMDTLEDHLVQETASVTVNGQEYRYQYTKSDDEAAYPYHQPDDYRKYNFLLEFELDTRYQAEASWFVSPRTQQAVVVKYPEFATRDEMEWIIAEFEEAEAAVYEGSYADIATAVDIDSFAKMYLIQELTVNLDACATSYYMYNDLHTGRLAAAPVWDYDWALGSYAGMPKPVVYRKTIGYSSSMADPHQMFAKVKSTEKDIADTYLKPVNLNFQAQLVSNKHVWERCRQIWTGTFVPVLDKYIVNARLNSDAAGVIEDEWLPAFSASLLMNDARWNVTNAFGDGWNTKVTADYQPRSYEFDVFNAAHSGTAEPAWENTVHYLNDWIAERWSYMSSPNGGALLITD